MIPLPSSVCPSGTCDSGADCTVPTLASKLGDEAPLAEVIQGYRDVEGDVGARRLQAVRLEERGLRVVPARLRGVEIAEREMQRGALRVARDVRAQLRLERLGLRVVGERGEPGDGGRVA